MEERETIYIIGAGVSGLIAAYELEQAGYRPVILEKAGEEGGRVKTVVKNGFALDIGFQVLLSAYPMANKYLDMDALKLRKLESGAMIYTSGTSYRIGDPMRNLSILFRTLTADIGSINDKLKILKLNQKLKDKSIEDIFNSPEKTTREYLIDFGFSDKIITRFFQPFFSGIFLEPNLNTSSRMFEFVYKMFGEGYATIPEKGIGEISAQLRSKLQHSEFVFNCDVESVTSHEITLRSGEIKSHEGVVITGNASALIPNLNDQDTAWKTCLCVYFEVDKTNITNETIALVADSGQTSNNLYAYRDSKSGKTILSVTSVKHQNKPESETIARIEAEVKKYTGATAVNYIHHFTINQVLPDINNLKMTAEPSESQVLQNVYLAGDYLFNGSLNAAMESGRLAALGLVEKKKGILV